MRPFHTLLVLGCLATAPLQAATLLYYDFGANSAAPTLTPTSIIGGATVDPWSASGGTLAGKAGNGGGGGLGFSANGSAGVTGSLSLANLVLNAQTSLNIDSITLDFCPNACGGGGGGGTGLAGSIAVQFNGVTQAPQLSFTNTDSGWLSSPSPALSLTGLNLSLAAGSTNSLAVLFQPLNGSASYAAQWRFDNFTVTGTTTTVPAPAGVWLLGSGIAGLTWLRRRATRH